MKTSESQVEYACTSAYYCFVNLPASSGIDPLDLMTPRRHRQLLQILNRLESFSSLKSNWDSYGGDPLDPTAIANAKEYVTEVFTAQKPFCSPLPDGGIQVDFEFDNSRTEVEIYRDSANVITSFAEFVLHRQISIPQLLETNVENLSNWDFFAYGSDRGHSTTSTRMAME